MKQLHVYCRTLPQDLELVTKGVRDMRVKGFPLRDQLMVLKRNNQILLSFCIGREIVSEGDYWRGFSGVSKPTGFWPGRQGLHVENRCRLQVHAQIPNFLPFQLPECWQQVCVSQNPLPNRMENKKKRMLAFQLSYRQGSVHFFCKSSDSKYDGVFEFCITYCIFSCVGWFDYLYNLQKYKKPFLAYLL